MFFKRRKHISVSYDKEAWEPCLKCSICTGEQVGGLRNIHTGEFREDCLIRTGEDLQHFKEKYEIETDLKKIY